jgi:hypothetical protein
MAPIDGRDFEIQEHRGTAPTEALPTGAIRGATGGERCAG